MRIAVGFSEQLRAFLPTLAAQCSFDTRLSENIRSFAPDFSEYLGDGSDASMSLSVTDDGAGNVMITPIATSYANGNLHMGG